MRSRITGMARKTPDSLRRGRHWLAGKYREVPLALAELRAKLAGRGANIRPSGVNPENIIWIFSSSGRSGTTWLRSMMGEMPRHRVWEEPMVGRLFGDFYGKAQTANLRRPDFIMADATRRGWIKSIRYFVLDGAKYARPRLGPDDHVVVKEPNGSIGAPLLMEALPESSMIFLVRDPRDVVASTLDGAREGNWLYEWRDEGAWKRGAQPDKDPDTFVRRRSGVYVRHTGKAKEAYDAHKGRKVLVRYEDLRADTLGEMKRLYAALEIPVNEKELAKVVEKHSWENIPEEEKGGGKFYRKASPGGWQEDLTPEQARLVEKITAPLLNEFYPRGEGQEPVAGYDQRMVKKTPEGRRNDAAYRAGNRGSSKSNMTTGGIARVDHKVRKFTLKLDQNETMLFKFNPRNLDVTLSGERAGPEDLKPGQWATVTYSVKDGVNLARSVEAGSDAVKPERIIWVFGAGRTGSSWLAGMMGDIKGVSVWFEPGLGEVLDPSRADLEHREGKHFVFAPQYRAVWLHSVRAFVLDGAVARFPERTKGGWLVVKEPHGSTGAPLLVEALPESRMVLLVRDPRDVAASWLDAASEGAWHHRRRTGRDLPIASLEERTSEYARNLGGAKRAYASHRGHKVLVRYEDLRADTLGTMKHLYSALEIPVNEKELAKVVEKHSWENIPEEEKGGGKFYRKASPGGWQEDLTPEQAEIVEKITAPLLEEFYPEKAP